MRVRPIHVLFVVVALAVCLIPFRAKVGSVAVSVIQILKGRKSIAERVAEFGDAVRNRLIPQYDEAFSRASGGVLSVVFPARATGSAT